MVVLITGGLGFIGRACIPRLVGAGCRVVVLDSLDETVHGRKPQVQRYLDDHGGAVSTTIGNVTDRATLELLLTDADVVIHLASLTSVPGSMQERARYCEENITGTAVLCDLLAGRQRVKRLVLASSRAVYGEGPYRCPRSCGVVEREGAMRGLDALGRAAWDPVCPDCGSTLLPLASLEESPLRPVSVYGTSKVAQEQLVSQLLPFSSIAATMLRFQNIYGPGQQRAAPDVGVANILAQRAVNGQGTTLFEDGRPQRDYVYIDDVADLVVHAALQGVTPARLELFNVGTGVGTTLLDLVELIGAASGKTIPVSVSGEFRVGDVRHAVGDIRRLSAHYRWTPVPLDEGIRRLVAWMRSGSRST